MKKLLSILLALLMLVSLASAALASEMSDEPEAVEEAAVDTAVSESEEPAADEPAGETDASAEEAEEPALDGETGYYLWICGTQVTSANKSDVFGNGKVSYDSTRRSLYIRGDLAGGSNVAIDSSIPNLTIVASSDVTVSSDSAAILLYANTQIGGTGKLTVSSGNTGIWVRDNVKLTVLSDLTVYAENGIMGMNGSSGEELVIGACNVSVSASYGIFNFSSITLDHSEITSPSGGRVVNGYAVYNSSNSIAQSVTIAPKDYKLTVCDTPVTGKNCSDVMGNGIFSYDPDTNTLTIKDSYEHWNTILVNDNPGLTVCIEKNLTLNSQGKATMIANRSMTITGPGDLTLKGDIELGTSLADLTLKDAYVSVTGSVTGYRGHGSLIIDFSYLGAYDDNGAVRSFAAITLKDSYISTPGNGIISDGAIRLPSGAINTAVAIKPVTYNLKITGIKVTAKNAADILGNGVFSYDPSLNRLTVSGSYSSTEKEAMIESGIRGLTIYIEKDLTLETDNRCVLTTFADTTITGPGKLTANSGNTYCLSIMGGDLTIENATLDLTGTNALYGRYETSVKTALTIRNSTVHATATTGAAVHEWKSITLEGCSISKPTGGVIKKGDLDFYSIEDASGSYAKEVTIVPGDMKGDVDKNGKVDNYDAALILRYSVGATVIVPSAWLRADANSDSVIDPADAAWVLRYVG